MRTLATIQIIESLKPIEGKDRIVLASFRKVGWHVIVDKSFSVGEKVVYVETDSILPVKPEFEGLRKRCWSEKWNGFRIRSMKMGNVFSEGICFHLKDVGIDESFKEEFDVTKIFGVIKYDPEYLEEQESIKPKYNWLYKMLFRVPFFKKILLPKKETGQWPAFMAHTDETRVQVLPYVFTDYQGLDVYVTEKVDGQSASFAIHKKKFYVCTRNNWVKNPQGNQKFWNTAIKYDIENKLRKASKKMKIDLYIQGEQCGPGIQANKLKLKETELFIFNIFDITNKRYFNLDEMIHFCITYSFKMTPVVDRRKFDWKNVDELVEYAKGESKLHQTPREGVVIRPVTPMPPDEKQANMRSFKVINPDFCIKHGD